MFETGAGDLLGVRSVLSLAQVRCLGSAHARAWRANASEPGGGKTWWLWDKVSIWRFSKGRDDEPVGDWQELGMTMSLTIQGVGLCGVAHEQPSCLRLSKNFHVVSENI